MPCSQNKLNMCIYICNNYIYKIIYVYIKWENKYGIQQLKATIFNLM